MPGAESPFPLFGLHQSYRMSLPGSVALPPGRNGRAETNYSYTYAAYESAPGASVITAYDIRSGTMELGLSGAQMAQVTASVTEIDSCARYPAAAAVRDALRLPPPNPGAAPTRPPTPPPMNVLAFAAPVDPPVSQVHGEVSISLARLGQRAEPSHFAGPRPPLPRTRNVGRAAAWPSSPIAAPRRRPRSLVPSPAPRKPIVYPTTFTATPAPPLPAPPPPPATPPPPAPQPGPAWLSLHGRSDYAEWYHRKHVNVLRLGQNGIRPSSSTTTLRGAKAKYTLSYSRGSNRDRRSLSVCLCPTMAHPLRGLHSLERPHRAGAFLTGGDSERVMAWSMREMTLVVFAGANDPRNSCNLPRARSRSVESEDARAQSRTMIDSRWNDDRITVSSL
jgi:hypothetical protein